MAGLDADVAVVGAGPAGAAAALFAAQSGRRVVVFDRAAFPRDKPCGEGLMPPGPRILAELSLHDAILGTGAPRIDGVVIAAAGQVTEPCAFPRGETGLGVRRLRFDAVLSSRLEQHPLIDYHQGVTVERVVPGRVPRVVTSVGEVGARAVAVADGLRSNLRRQLGWTRGPRPPHRYGIVGHWHGGLPRDPWIRLTIHSGFETYRAPVGPDEHLVALLCSHDQMASFASGLSQQYRELVLATHPDLEKAELIPGVSAIGPFRHGASTVAGEGIFLMGDASGFVDPITGEGLASGLEQAKAFNQALAHPHPEAEYRRLHRGITRNRWRLTVLLVYLASNPGRVTRAMRGLNRRPSVMPALLGINLGYWGFGRVTPREWVALLAGW
jgi:flavin-dependent dehydrogenase